jgi:hypothetical protein
MVSEVSGHHSGEGVAEQSISLQEGQKVNKREYRKGSELETTPKDTPPISYLLQLGSTSYFSPSPNNATIL